MPDQRPLDYTEALAAIRRLPPHQREALGFIAINQDGQTNPRTREALERKGLAESSKQVLSTKNGPNVTITRHSIPLPVHMAWCKWCDENVSDEELKDA